jgi:hypothetical protein
MKKIISILAVSSLLPAFVSCKAAPPPPPATPSNLPSADLYPGYKIIDSVDKDTAETTIKSGEKIAIVLRDNSTTAYSFIEPRYNNSMVHFDGKSNCCLANPKLIGSSGMAVYKFSFIGLGKTNIQIIARHKGLSSTAESFDTDLTYATNVEVLP